MARAVLGDHAIAVYALYAFRDEMAIIFCKAGKYRGKINLYMGVKSGVNFARKSGSAISSSRWSRQA